MSSALPRPMAAPPSPPAMCRPAPSARRRQRSSASRAAAARSTGLARRRGRIRRGQRQQVRDQAREAHRLGLGGRQLLLHDGIVAGHRRRLDAQAQARQRRAQLMRGVGDERALRVERLRQPVGHRVERRATSRCSAEPSTSARASRSPVPTRRAVAGQPAQRPRERAGDEPRHDAARRAAPADRRRRARAGRAGSGGRWRRRSGSRARHRRSARGDDRHCGVEQVLAERLRSAGGPARCGPPALPRSPAASRRRRRACPGAPSR